MRKQPFNFKLEEFIPFCRFTLESFKTDKPEFIKFSPDYDGDFLETTEQSLGNVDKIINPQALTARMKKTTELLYGKLDGALLLIDSLERYCEKAGPGLLLTKKDLGFSVTRTKCHNRDAEGAAAGLKKAEQLVIPYLTLLELKGYTKAKQEDLSKQIKDIEDANILQNSLQNERAKLVQDNMEKIKDFWEVINDILKTGKIIFKENPLKIKEYTQTQIISRIRREISPEATVKKVKSKAVV